ncbi:LacI family transcriptional regulator [Plasticicumulans lactativorans]|uniref:LacI family transcriptional regulator n=1 Tax=Plasticicumulans lactativorans TaxID=1133106 RepID=A0A4R2LDM2_9GAMM|nr:LacI family DNA-binding transcriptional regulator [Plasticicumulans lactativorans]TCO82702.1 LacI family transcriptional regulator [Plasticicumulans lactativorans]
MATNDEKKPLRRKKTPRFEEIAAATGVSISTVDRVLNERGSVSPATRASVIAAARKLGVPRILPDARHGLLRLDVLLPDNNTPFFRRLRQALQRVSQMLDKRVVVRQLILPEHDDGAMYKAILHPPYRRHGLIATVPDNERVREALRQVLAEGVPVVAMVNAIADMPQLHYVGIDNHRAGRTAGYFLGRLVRRPGRVLLLGGRLDYEAHVDRSRGCREVLAELYPELTCNAQTVTTHDDPDQCYLAVARTLKANDDLVGIYNSGAGSPGIEAALRKFDMAGKVAWVGHEPSDEHRQYIKNRVMDLVIDQDPDGQAINALQYLLHACGMVEVPPPSAPNEFRLYCLENMWQRHYLPGGADGSRSRRP